MSLAELAKLNDTRYSEGEFSDLTQDAPVLREIEAIPASNGMSHRYYRTTTASSAGFRAIDAGLIKTKAGRTAVDVTMEVIDGTFTVDIAEAEAAAMGVDAYLEKEQNEALKTLFSNLEKQLFYGTGTGGDSDGFAGLADDALFNALADDRVLSKGGSTVDSQTSVWAVRSNPEGFALVLGKDGNMVYSEDPQIVNVYEDPTTDAKSYAAYQVPIIGYGGIQVGAKLDVARLANVETALTDDDLSQLVELFDNDPTHIFMSKKARRLLQTSRTATTATGAAVPRPTDHDGIPIIATNSLINTEAVVA